MKTSALAAVVALFFLTSPTDADIRFDGEHSVLTAEMTVVDAHLDFADVVASRITLTTRHGAEHMTGLAISNQLRFSSKLEELFLVVKKADRDSCGSTHYFARLMDMDQPLVRYTVELVDHLTRTCDDIVRHRWEARVTHGYGVSGPVSHLTLVGDPRPAEL